ncbi:N-terminal phage replisome organizer [Popillia japonica]|uniref:N-terminal phage replisome organizer n=1 Tax=Popillia japonica TaxID=7064 RepID=A0AAW1HSR8_POPJA
MRLKEGFFDSDALQVMESMPDGCLYSNILNILLKMYLKSLKNNGKLMFNEVIPYNPQMLATITRHSVGVVEKALNIFRQLGLVEVLDNGAIYMLDIQNYIGKSTTEADRKRAYRDQIESEKVLSLDKCPDISPFSDKSRTFLGHFYTRDRDRYRYRDR